MDLRGKPRCPVAVVIMAAALLASAVRVQAGPHAPRASEAPCAATYGLAAVLEHVDVLLLGELHGTAQAPRFAAAAVCRALGSGLSVTVGIEWVETEQARVDTYLDSDGGAAARDALLAGEIWQARGEAQYGATSEAMLGLLDDLRVQRRGGGAVEIFLFNRQASSARGRDQRMADALADATATSASNLWIVLTGNIHSRLAPGAPWDDKFEPMGFLLQQARPETPILALEQAHAGGTAWLCVSGKSCGVHVQRASDEDRRGEFTVSVGSELGPRGHHGTYFVGTIEASLPAVPDTR